MRSSCAAFPNGRGQTTHSASARYHRPAYQRRMAALIPGTKPRCTAYRHGKPPDASVFLERYRAYLAAIAAECQPEIDTLARKLARQDTGDRIVAGAPRRGSRCRNLQTLNPFCGRVVIDVVVIAVAHDCLIAARGTFADPPSAFCNNPTGDEHVTLAGAGGGALHFGGPDDCGYGEVLPVDRVQTGFCRFIPSGIAAVLNRLPWASRPRSAPQSGRALRSRQGRSASRARAYAPLVRKPASLAFGAPGP